MSKASHIRDCRVLEDIPNIGRSLGADLRLLGIRKPAELSGRDPYALYDALRRKTRARPGDEFLALVEQPVRRMPE